jgi:hypothetical protein
MKLLNGELVMETTKCHCHGGVTIQYAPCKFDGRAQRGVKCEICGSVRKRHEFLEASRHSCERCGGTGVRNETLQDSVPQVEWEMLPVKVVDHGRRTTMNDALLGFGAIFTCLDYGRSRDLSDVELIESALGAHGGVSGYHIAREDGEVASYIEIERKSSGYAVRARWADGGTNR